MYNITRQELYNLYWKQEMSTREINKIFGACQATVMYYMRKYNIPRRTSAETMKMPKFRRKISETEKGKVVSIGSREQMSETKKKLYREGKITVWNKGKKTGPPSEETKIKLSEANKDQVPWIKDKHHTEEAKEKIRKAQLKLCENPEERRKRSERQTGKFGDDWEGFVSPINRRIRKSWKFRQWRGLVFERDNYTCQECGTHNGNGKTIYLYPHHIRLFSKYPELRFDINNGITLCEGCHEKTKWIEEQLVEYFQNKLNEVGNQCTLDELVAKIKPN